MRPLSKNWRSNSGGFSILYMTKFSKKGFTLLDVMFAVGLAIVGLIGILGLLRYVIIVGRASSDRFIAENLAEEGIELVRFYRDSNWKQYMSIYTPATFLISGPQDYEVDYTLNPTLSSLPANSNRFLNIDANGFYSYAAGTATKFKRKITLDPTKCQYATGDDGTCISVVSDVSWGNNHIIIEDWLYKWLP
jgi:Tfp pilus assembly protein PilV